MGRAAIIAARRGMLKGAEAEAMKALWRRLDTPGHDSALLRRSESGWLLTGFAVFRHASGPSGLAYEVEADGAWATRRGRISGFLGATEVDHDIRRDPDGWRLNGVRTAGLGHLLDLDLSFTPATNLLQLRRATPEIGQAVSLPAAWFDLDAGALSELPQSYARIAERSYRYAAPSVGYEGVLEMSADGFVARYPGLWRREA